MPFAAPQHLNVEVTLNRAELVADELQTCSLIEIRESCDRAVSIVLTFEGRDPLGQQPAFLDDPRFCVGADVAIVVGYPQVQLALGDVLRRRVELRANGTAFLTLEGYGLRHRLGREPRTVSWEDMTDGAIAARIAARCGFASPGRPTQEVHARLDQLDQTDLDFLSSRAAAVGRELWVEGKELWFESVEDRRRNIVALTAADLLEFEDTIDATELLDGVDVPWVDPTLGLQGIATATANQSSLASRLRQQFGTRRQWIEGIDARTAAAAQLAADMHLAQPLKEHAVVTATCRGRPDVRIGTRVQLTGLGAPLDGDLAVCETVHRFAGSEYRTTFTARRLP